MMLEGALRLTVIVVVSLAGLWVIGVVLRTGVRVGYALMELVF